MRSVRRGLALLICALLMAGMIPASAAPARDQRPDSVWMEGDPEGLLSVVMSAAMLKDQDALAAGSPPAQGLVEAAFAVYVYNSRGLERVTLEEGDCAELYDALFASGSFHMPEKGDCPCVTVENGRMTLDLAELNETPLVGAWIYSAREENGTMRLDMDLYTAWGYYMTPALEIPEEDLTWYRHCTAVLSRAEESAFGWRLVSFQTGPIYQDGAFSAWQEYANPEAGYSLMLPSLMGQSRSDANDVLFETADGTASVRIERIAPMTRDQALSETAALKSGITLEDAAFSLVLHIAPTGARILMYESDSCAYRVTLTYPSERMEEYGLYAEIMRNSFTIWGLSNG